MTQLRVMTDLDTRLDRPRFNQRVPRRDELRRDTEQLPFGSYHLADKDRTPSLSPRRRRRPEQHADDQNGWRGVARPLLRGPLNAVLRSCSSVSQFSQLAHDSRMKRLVKLVGQPPLFPASRAVLASREQIAAASRNPAPNPHHRARRRGRRRSGVRRPGRPPGTRRAARST